MTRGGERDGDSQLEQPLSSAGRARTEGEREKGWGLEDAQWK